MERLSLQEPQGPWSYNAVSINRQTKCKSSKPYVGAEARAGLGRAAVPWESCLWKHAEARAPAAGRPCRRPPLGREGGGSCFSVLAPLSEAEPGARVNTSGLAEIMGVEKPL